MGKEIQHNSTNQCLRCGDNNVEKSRRKVILHDPVGTEENKKQAEKRAFHDLLTWGKEEYSDREMNCSGNLCEDCFCHVVDFIRGD